MCGILYIRNAYIHRLNMLKRLCFAGGPSNLMIIVFVARCGCSSAHSLVLCCSFLFCAVSFLILFILTVLFYFSMVLILECVFCFFLVSCDDFRDALCVRAENKDVS